MVNEATLQALTTILKAVTLGSLAGITVAGLLTLIWIWITDDRT